MGNLFKKYQADNEALLNSYGREFKTSKLFSFSNSSAISAGAELVLSFSDLNSQCAKYSPFNNLRIVNNSNVEISIYPNQDLTQEIPIASGTTQIFPEDTIRFIRSLKIKNNDSTNSVSINQIKVQVWKDVVSTDEVLKRVHQKIFSPTRRTGVY